MTVKGTIVTLEVEPSNTVKILKEKIQDKEGIMQSDFWLHHAGERLAEEDGDHLLADYGVQNESTVYICLRLPSCANYYTDYYYSGKDAKHVEKQIRPHGKHQASTTAQDLGKQQRILVNDSRTKSKASYPSSSACCRDRGKKTRAVPWSCVRQRRSNPCYLGDDWVN
jgi:hypothetical protein